MTLNKINHPRFCSGKSLSRVYIEKSENLLQHLYTQTSTAPARVQMRVTSVLLFLRALEAAARVLPLLPAEGEALFSN